MWMPVETETNDNQDEMRESYTQGGRVALDVLRHAKKKIAAGMNAFDYAEELEQLIIDSGMELGFPVNLSINEIAAHYTPSRNDQLVFTEEMVVKVDIGISTHGYVTDFAFTADLGGKNTSLLSAAAEALKNAVALVKNGCNTKEIGTQIEKTIRETGFRPIANLTGHMLKKNILHAGVSIPNVAMREGYQMRTGEVFAIEPFASAGRGYVEELDQIEIFSLETPKTPRLRHARDVLDYLKKEHPFLPFSERSLYRKFDSKLVVSTAMREFLMNGTLTPYPVLSDTGKVSQFETTVIVEEHGCTEVVPVAEITKV